MLVSKVGRWWRMYSPLNWVTIGLVTDDFNGFHILIPRISLFIQKPVRVNNKKNPENFCIQSLVDRWIVL